MPTFKRWQDFNSKGGSKAKIFKVTLIKTNKVLDFATLLINLSIEKTPNHINLEF